MPGIFELNRRYYMGVYLTIAIALSIIAQYSNGGNALLTYQFSYSSPLVVIASFALFISFTKIKFTSKLINFIASSCFAVYLLHEHTSISKSLYRPFINQLYFSNSPYISNVVDVLLWMLLVYFVAILLDKIRFALWVVISRFYENIINRYKS